ncbi:hypothetical protein HGRIS_000476 [Hohenbuehelia grisea]|uniref:Uncharacterized protein n=1 Tax=Hohenbuehelia grisea TaxID=104357 RepID=A0ABR3JT57_9AGAR
MAYVRVPTPRTAAEISFILLPRQPPVTSADIDFTGQRLARYAPAPRVQDGTGSTSSDEGGAAEPGDYEEDDLAPIGATTKIPKPPGEPGCPDSGGWALKDQLVKTEKWGDKEYKAIRARVNAIAKEKNLNLGISYGNQKPEDIDAVCERIQSEYIFLEKYEDCWPIRCILKSILKYRAEASRKVPPQPQT